MSTCSISARRSAARCSTASAGRTSRPCGAWRKGRDGDLGNAHLSDIVYDWNEPGRVVKVDVLQDKAAQLGITSETIATALNGIIGGATATQVRDSIYLVSVIGRARDGERSSIETLQNLQIQTSAARPCRSRAVANFRYESEQPVVWRRGRLPTITVKAAVDGTAQPATVVEQLAGRLGQISASLPAGYRIATAGAVEESAKGQAPIVAIVPIMLFAMATILMIQLQSFQRLFLVVIVAPLGLIGVVAALLPSGAPLGFVAILGVLALIGILIRNSVILVIQIEQLRSEGMDGWTAVVEATEHRMRPIMLTAAAASLALIPIAREVFWGPMAYAMMGGIIVGTVLTLLFLPALYIAWFRLKEPPTPGAAALAMSVRLQRPNACASSRRSAAAMPAGKSSERHPRHIEEGMPSRVSRAGRKSARQGIRLPGLRRILAGRAERGPTNAMRGSDVHARRRLPTAELLGRRRQTSRITRAGRAIPLLHRKQGMIPKGHQAKDPLRASRLGPGGLSRVGRPACRPPWRNEAGSSRAWCRRPERRWRGCVRRSGSSGTGMAVGAGLTEPPSFSRFKIPVSVR